MRFRLLAVIIILFLLQAVLLQPGCRRSTSDAGKSPSGPKTHYGQSVEEAKELERASKVREQSLKHQLGE